MTNKERLECLEAQVAELMDAPEQTCASAKPAESGADIDQVAGDVASLRQELGQIKGRVDALLGRMQRCENAARFAVRS